MKLVWPVPRHRDGRAPRVSQGFTLTKGGTHAGLDIMYRRPESGPPRLPQQSKWYEMPGGIPALAAADGTVVKAYKARNGMTAVIQHRESLRSAYVHMRTLRVGKGEIVRQGQPIGDIYHNPAGYRLNHLHFELRQGGDKVNPEPFLAEVLDNPWKARGIFLATLVGVGGGYLAWRWQKG